MQKSAALRWSLLTSLGLVPIACAASSTDEPSGKPIERPPGCTSPIVDPLTGLTTCQEGYRYRAEPMECVKRHGEVTTASGGSGGEAGEAGAAGETDAGEQPSLGSSVKACTTTADCSEVPHGVCFTSQYFQRFCVAGCVNDSECASSELCKCGSDGGVCVPARCHSDQDCEPGYHCSEEDSCGLTPFSCQNARDECTQGRECNNLCLTALGQDHRTCGGVTCGRPFLVAKQPRLAPVVSGSDWLLRPLT